MQGIVRAANRKGEFDSVGSKIIRNDTKEELINVYIQEVHTTPERAKQLVS
ncbi:MAG: hypothetical protein ACXACY_29140 [Candidatus Hodarchaeales archaeon]|jgi:hypothetical protein